MNITLSVHLIWFGFAVLVTSCFKAPFTTQGSVESIEGEARVGLAKTFTESKAVYSFDPKDNNGSVLSAPSGSLRGSSVTIAAHSLAIAADLIFEEAVPLVETSLSSNLQIDGSVSMVPVGAGLIIRPSVELELGGPLQISMPLGAGAGSTKLKSSTQLQGGKYIAVFYKQYRGGTLRDGIIPDRDLRYTDHNKVAFEGYFGSYWVVELSAPLEERVPVESSEPIVNFQKVAVVESTGITAESAITVKAAIPPVAWRGTRIFYTAADRSVTVEGTIEGTAAVTQCKADLFTDIDNNNGMSLDSGSRLQANLVIAKKEAHELFGRFRCFDDQGRLTISPWSAAAAIPAINEKPFYSAADFFVWKPQVQSRELLKLVVSARVFADKAAFTVFDATSGSSLFDSRGAAPNPYLRRETLADGRELLSFKLSPLGQLNGFAYDANHLELRGADGLSQIDAAFAIRDFTLFYPSVMTSFPASRQQASDGFQGWTSVLSNPVAKDNGTGSTRLTHGMLNIINP